MLHVCRDFRTSGNNLSINIPLVANYFVAIFAFGVLGYTQIGQTNFDLAGTYCLFQGTTGALNQGTGNEYAFLPNGYAVTSADIGRILVIRSTSYGMLNSGLFRVTGVDTLNNWLYINYRSGDLPPAETNLTFSLFAEENTFSTGSNFTGNGISGTYTGQGTATQSRLILQSPGGYQVRFALENSTDVGVGVSPSNGTNGSTTAPGFGGNTKGDFLPGGQHLHTALFFNVHNTLYDGCTVGLWPSNCNQARIYMWGDDGTGTIFAAARKVIGVTDSFVHFGLPEDEEQPLPPKTIQRMFAMGASTGVNAGNNGIYWASGFGTSRAGVGFGLSNQPISCIYSLFNRLDGGEAVRNSVNASDNPYLSATELFPVDLVVGTEDNQASQFSSTPEAFNLEGRRIGRAPFVRLGRSNYGNYQVSVDNNHSWIHLSDGIYLPWQGSILP